MSNVRILLIGDANVGKTNLIEHWTSSPLTKKYTETSQILVKHHTTIDAEIDFYEIGGKYFRSLTHQ
jgi:GTPase SAR1 family protein